MGWALAMGIRLPRARRPAGSPRGTGSCSIRLTAPRPSPRSRSSPGADSVGSCSGTRLRSPGVREVSRARSIRVNAGDAGLAVAVRGEGAPLLFVHGFPFDHTMWRHQLGSLDGWCRIAPDLRGVRASTAPHGGYTMARYADDLAAILDTLEIDRATVCGQSLGGYIVFELLRRHPDRVGAPVRVATKPDADTPEGQRARDQVVAQAEREGPAAVADGMLPRLLGRTTRATRPGVAEAGRRMAGGWSVAGMVGAQRAMRARPDSTETLRRLLLPALVIGGGGGGGAAPARAAGGGARHSNAPRRVLPGAGAVVAPQRPADTTRALAAFLATLARGGALPQRGAAG